MDPLVLSLWHGIVDAYDVAFRAAPTRSVWVTPTATLSLSGEPLAYFNVLLIVGGDQPAEQLQRLYGHV